MIKHIQNVAKKVTIIGIGGELTQRIAIYLHLLGKTIVGYDQSKSKVTRSIENLGIFIHYGNPVCILETDLVIYSSAIPINVVSRIQNNYEKRHKRSIPIIESGAFVHDLLTQKEQGLLTKKENTALIRSSLAPLYSLDVSGIKMIGVTGTDGKSTVCEMIFFALSQMGYQVGLISTLGCRIGKELLSTGLHTTTTSQQKLFSLLETMKRKKCTHIIVECTSQGLFMGRLTPLKFDIAVFTNITRDHFNYHYNWKSYTEAKALLITKHLKQEGSLILNKDDSKSYEYLSLIKKPTFSYSINPKNLRMSEDVITAKPLPLRTENVYSYKGKEYRLQIIGTYNISNALATAATLQVLGVPVEETLIQLSAFPGLRGRMQVLQSTPFTVIIDFAHTSNALKKALITARSLLHSKGRLILVFGCASQRDDGKRLLMGKIAKKYADVTILTAEDPRQECLKAINDQIVYGWNEVVFSNNRSLIRFDDDREKVAIRRKAIQKALSLATGGDVVLITGKGHENSLCFGTREYSWSDIRETKGLLKKIHQTS